MFLIFSKITVTSWSKQGLLEELMSARLQKEFLASYKDRMFTTAKYRIISWID
jgi:hypothetical protein